MFSRLLLLILFKNVSLMTMFHCSTQPNPNGAFRKARQGRGLTAAPATALGSGGCRCPAETDGHVAADALLTAR